MSHSPSAPFHRPLPPGSVAIASWASRTGRLWEPRPVEAWYRAWEPFDTLVSPAAYFNAVSARIRRAELVTVEPWASFCDEEPRDRAVMVFVTHPEIAGCAALRVGASHRTRASFLTSPPPTERPTGDPKFDAVATCYADTPGGARATFRRTVRGLLLRSTFIGHLEIKRGGFVLHREGLTPTPKGYAQCLAFGAEVLSALLGRT